MVGALVLAIGAVVYAGYRYFTVTSRLEDLQVAVTQAQQDSAQLAETIAKVENLQARRDSIAQKVAILQEIDGDRYVWSHLMDEVARALPDYTWLTSLVQIQGGQEPNFRVVGRAGNNFALTRFMENMEASPFIRNVTLISTEQVVETRTGGSERLVNDFTLEAFFEDPPPEILETVPLFGPVAELP